ncbi:MAG: methionine gamma-lyase family protein, partial [Vallitaleaceae bacterium]|nr:methionine gamma-lyase family protein [Vallitaleaceae bacterium]
MINTMYDKLGLSKEVIALSEKVEAKLFERFVEIDKIAEHNQLKVLSAMQQCRLSDTHFTHTTGYGYNDHGRDTLEEV